MAALPLIFILLLSPLLVLLANSREHSLRFAPLLNEIPVNIEQVHAEGAIKTRHRSVLSDHAYAQFDLRSVSRQGLQQPARAKLQISSSKGDDDVNLPDSPSAFSSSGIARCSNGWEKLNSVSCALPV
jgi:hypothetical protein